jgi:hypothetical protein
LETSEAMFPTRLTNASFLPSLYSTTVQQLVDDDEAAGGFSNNEKVTVSQKLTEEG